MGWGTNLFCNVYYSKQTYNDKYAVEKEIEELREYDTRIRKQIRDFVIMTEPNKYCPENYDPLIWITNEVEDLLNELEGNNIELYKLELLLDNWDNCHDEAGNVIKPTENIEWDTAYIDGDFIK